MKNFPGVGLEEEVQYCGPRSPDITSLNFFLWGYVKDIVYQSLIRDTDELKSRITAVIQTVDSAMLHRM
ncbi:hypothetical protein AVEN_106128-1, partial [Araneus ventricosus]